MDEPGLTVLHIDDDPDFRFLVRELAAAAGLSIQWLEASTGEEALTGYTAARPHLVLLDNRLGPADGVQWLPRLRAAWLCPIWLLTGIPEAGLAERAGAAGAAGLLAKDDLLGQPRLLVSLLFPVTDRGGDGRF
jgi:CheY-like chemotaxis protein